MIDTMKRYQRQSNSKESGMALDPDFSQSLHFSVWPAENFDRFLELIDQNPESIHGRYGFSNETLLHRACRYGNSPVFDYLITRKAVLTARNKFGATPLHLASKYKRLEFINILLAENVPLEERDDQGDQAMHYAAKSGCIECINMLVQAGAPKCTTGFRGNTIVHYAAQNGKLDLIKEIFAQKCPVINKGNELSETPLHMAASCYTKEHNNGVDVITVMLELGASLNARTIWGDTAVHYAGRWGNQFVLEFLLNQGIEVGKQVDDSHKAFFEKLEIPEDTQDDFNCSLLQKVAKSTCIKKAQIVLNKIMDARNKVAKNMYYSNRGIELPQDEMNNQEKEFLQMSPELQINDNSNGAIQMFLKYSPDSLTLLFDRCIIKPCQEQVQGRIYLDLFLFHSKESPCGRSGELNIVENLMAMSKERFLIHPLFEVFLKMKWYKTWLYYCIYILVSLAFLVSLCGYTLAHFGKIVEGMENYSYKERNIWCVLERQFLLFISIVKDLVMPILIGVVLYGNLSEIYVRYVLACSIILACYSFMNVISRLPRVGLYVHMLSKVMGTVLNFFTSYVWHFLGYAIAFHILLPGSKPFGLFSDSFIKVMTMLMGEYDYTLYFVQDENSSIMAKIIFVMFLVDMSVVLMNLVLGLAIADIEELQRNSAVRRMMQETGAIVFTENIINMVTHLFQCKKMLSTRIVTERTNLFQDIIYLDLVDLDKNPNNLLVLDRVMPDRTSYYPCPHGIVVNVAKIVQDSMRRRLDQEDKKLDAGLGEMEKIRRTQVKIITVLDNLTACLADLKSGKFHQFSKE